MLKVSYVAFSLDNNLQSFVVIFIRLLIISSRFLFGEFLWVVQIWWSSATDRSLQFILQIFKSELCVLGCCHVGRQSDDPDPVLVLTAGGFLSKSLPILYFFSAFLVCEQAATCQMVRTQRSLFESPPWPFAASISIYYPIKKAKIKTIYPSFFMIPSTLTSFPVPDALELTHSIILPPSCFSVRIMFFSFNWSPIFLWESLWLKISSFIPSDQRTCSQYA